MNLEHSTTSGLLPTTASRCTCTSATPTRTPLWCIVEILRRSTANAFDLRDDHHNDAVREPQQRRSRHFLHFQSRLYKYGRRGCAVAFVVKGMARHARTKQPSITMSRRCGQMQYLKVGYLNPFPEVQRS